MKLKIAINGFGRIGRLVMREALKHPHIEVVAINDLTSTDNLAYLFCYDSTHGKYDEAVSYTEDHLIVGQKKIRVFAERDPHKLPWKDLKIDYVVEATGIFITSELAQVHIQQGAKRVIITAPAKDQTPTFVMGVNQDKYNPKEHTILSNASCTTNCLAPIAKVLLKNFGIEEGLMTTIHALTATQPTVDGSSKKDFRGGRGALQNIIPATTGAAKAVALCLPELQGKLTGMAFRVPIADVSCVDLTVKLKKETSYEEVCEAMFEASNTYLKNILAYTDEPLVSSDFIGSRFSSIFDKEAGIALNSKFYKLIAWYDNEMGYACRVVDLIEYIGSCE